jgi:hypothetical protein
VEGDNLQICPKTRIMSCDSIKQSTRTISRESKDIIDAMRVLIEKGETDHLKKSVTGWQYGGLWPKVVDRPL